MKTENVFAVVGAQYGDEGKGRAVDWLARRNGADRGRVMVARHNASCQAGHTVLDGEGRRHVFSHLGSGTLAGAGTMLVHKFVANPLVFNAEWNELTKLGITPEVVAHHDVRLSTPVDTLLNQLTEKNRGHDRHGSCGVGFGETLQRAEQAEHTTLTFGTAWDGNRDDKYREICEYALEQIEERELRTFNAHDLFLIEQLKRGADAWFWTHYSDQLDLLDGRVAFTNDADYPFRYHETVIFEGAQGLQLHQDHEENFPHVTRSRTGLEDVVELLNESEVVPPNHAVHAFYCTRAYVTRHGHGPLAKELTLEDMQGLGYQIEDETNQPNSWQGRLRFAEYDHDLLTDEVSRDLNRTATLAPLRPLDDSFIISCCDQVPDRAYTEAVNGLLNYADGSVYSANGPRHDHVREE